MYLLAFVGNIECRIGDFESMMYDFSEFFIIYMRKLIEFIWEKENLINYEKDKKIFNKSVCVC